MLARFPLTFAAAAAALLTMSFAVAASGEDAQSTTLPSLEQTESPSATPAADGPTSAPGEDIASADPAVVLGGEIRGVSTISGHELMAQLDPEDPHQAQDIADIEALLEATGAGLDELTMLNAVASDGQTFVGAIRVEGADQRVVKSMFVASAVMDLGQPDQSEMQVGGKDVTRLLDADAEGQPPLFIYAASETVWLISGSEEAASTVLESLP